MTRTLVAFPAIAALVALPAAGSGAATSPPVIATATLSDAAGGELGTVIFAASAGGSLVAVHLHGVKPGTYAMHIHEQGTCTPPDFASAGGHFNPGQTAHGHAHGGPGHAGDLPNVVVGQDGSGTAAVLAAQLHFGGGPDTLDKPGGTAVILHTGPDDDQSQPSGNAGGRMACGVVVRR